MSAAQLARPEIRTLRPYVTARQLAGTVRLNANEAPWPPAGGYSGDLNRYPEICAERLQARLAEYYGVAQDMLLATRGSSEAIDLLVRAFCRPGVDSIAITSPTFAMYRVYADIQGAQTVDVPLLEESGFRFDTGALLERCTTETKLVFVCSPNNPTGNLVSRDLIRELADARQGRSLVVVDEAYIEFSDTGSASALLGHCDNVVILRTMSKAHALAGARCGAVLGRPEAIRILRSIIAPYAFATPVVERVLHALSPPSLAASQAAIRQIREQRDRMSAALARCNEVLEVWPSAGNFLLARFRDFDALKVRLAQRRILIRDYEQDELLRNCARITIGAPDENDLLLATLGALSIKDT